MPRDPGRCPGLNFANAFGVLSQLTLTPLHSSQSSLTPLHRIWLNVRTLHALALIALTLLILRTRITLDEHTHRRHRRDSSDDRSRFLRSSARALHTLFYRDVGAF